VRIAIVETAPLGGLLHYAVQLGDGLAERGHDVELIVPRDNELAEHRGAATMRAVLTPPVRGSDAPPSNRIGRVVRRAGVALRLGRAWSEVVWRANRGDFDVVVLNPGLHLSLSAFGALTLGVVPHRFKIANVAHNVEGLDRFAAEGERRRVSITRAILRRALARFDLVFVHGERSRRVYRERWPSTRVAVIPHGDERIFGDAPPPADEERILFFGDWNVVKGLPVLMEAFDLLIAERPGVRLTIAGTPYPRDIDVDGIERWARGHGDAVELIGRYVALEEVPGVFGRARVVVTPYVAGFQSGVIHLAMTMARAVVTSDVGDLSSAVRDGETGLVVPPKDPGRLSEALATVVSDPELAQRYGLAGREKVLADSGWEQVAAEAEAALESLVEGSPERPGPRAQN
jgi:glycosyltransferase involved in cell wall biosynthesis